jgi:hypothetical protein
MTRLAMVTRVFTSPINNCIHIFMTLVACLARHASTFKSPFPIPMIHGLILDMKFNNLISEAGINSYKLQQKRETNNY